MRKLTSVLLAVALTAACHRAPAPPPPAPPPTPRPATGPLATAGPATDARGAIERFLAAAKDQDLQALAEHWGTATGSIRNGGGISREELEKREVIMMCYLRHDTRRIIGDAPAQAGERVLAVEMHLGALTRTTNFYAVGGPGGRWYVRSFDMEPLTDFCKRK